MHNFNFPCSYRALTKALTKLEFPRSSGIKHVLFTCKNGAKVSIPYTHKIKRELTQKVAEFALGCNDTIDARSLLEWLR